MSEDAPGEEQLRAAAVSEDTPEEDELRAAAVSEDTPEEDELRAAAVSGVRWSSIARPLNEVMLLGSIVVLARLIPPAEFGRFAIALIAQEVAYIIVSGGLSGALVQQKEITREHLQAGMALGLALGFVLAAVTLAVIVVVVNPVFGARTALFVRLMVPLCFVSAAGTVPMATLRRRMAFRRLSEIEVLNAFVRIAVSIGLAIAGLGGEALVLGVVAGSVLSTAVAWASAPPPLPRLHRAASRELLDYGVPASVAAVSWVGFSNVDYAIIGASLGPFQTGLYFRAYTVAVEYQAKVSVVMSQVGFPVLARTRNDTELTVLYRQMVRMLTIVLFPLLALLAIVAPVMVPFVFGPRWTGAVVPVQILALGGASTLVIDAVGTVLMATGRARALLGYGTAHFIVYGLTVLAIVHLGIVAVAIDAAVVHTLFLAVAYVVMLEGWAERPLRRLWDDVAPATVSCLGLVAVALPAYLALNATQLPAIVRLVAVGLVAVPPYLLALRVCFPAAWRSQRAILARILPGNARLPGAKRRLRAAGARSGA